MAGGNLGDLSFSLTLKSRIEDETKKIIKDLNKVDETGKRAQQALEAISEAVKGIGSGNTHSLDKFKEIFSSVLKDIQLFNSEDFFDPKKVRQLNAVSEGLVKINNIIGEISKNGGVGFSIFPNGTAKEVNEAAKAYDKLSSFLKELNTKHGQGFNVLGVDATQNIRQSISELSKYQSILEQIRNNGGVHPVTGLTANDIVKSSEYLKLVEDAKTYAKEIKQSLKDVDDAKKASVEEEKRNEQIVENILQRRAQERQRAAEKEAEIERQRQEQAKISAQIAQENAKSEIKWNEQKAKANSEALQRQMKASVEEEKKRQVSLLSNGFDTTILEKRLAMLNRMKEIQDKLAYYHPKAQYAFLDYESGLKFGNANTPTMRHKEDELQRLRNIIADLEAEFNKLGGNDAFKNVDNQVKNLEQTIARLKESGGQLNLGKMLGLENKSTDEFRIAKEAAMATEAHTKKQNELTAAFEKYFRVQEQVEAAEKRLAEATARTNQARREAIAASRQQAESLVRDRIKELEAQRQQLQGLFGSGKNVLNTQELFQLQQAFSQITQELNTLRSVMNNLGSYSIKDLFSIGRGTSDYTPLIGSMRTVLDQKQEAINLERKHQEEIARTAAKARNDLAAAFAGANAEAKKMQSIVGDIKSLFLQGGIVFGAQQFFNSIVQTGGEIVQQHVALRSILGDVQKADELFAQTQQLALQSPFKFGELNRDVKQLAAFGVEANDLYDTTKRLADIASGLGVSFERLGLAFGQVKARSWLDGKELRQFAYAGLPLLQKITELYNSEGKNGRKNYTQADVKKMISGRQVSFEDVQKVLWKMTDEGGQFYNMQLVLSETLLGRWNKLIDAWDIMLGKFAEGKSVIGGTFSFLINRVTDLVLALDKLSPAMLSFGAIFAARKLGLMASGNLGLGSINKNYTQQMNAQLRTYAIEQQQLVTEGKITQQKALQNVQARAYLLSDTTSRANAMSRLALEGKMSVLQMQKAVKEGLVTKELIRQLAVMGQITARQEQIILGGTRFAAVMNMGIAKIGGGIKSLFTMLGGWWGLAIGGAVQLISSYSNQTDRIYENAKNLRESAYEKTKGYDDMLSQGKPSNNGDMQQRIKDMEELLKNSGDYTQTIDDQIARAKSLNEQYDILNKGIIAAKQNSQAEQNDADIVAGAIGATGGWTQGLLFNDTIEENVEDLNKALAEYQTSLSVLDSVTKDKMSSVANEFLKPEERTKSLEEKIRILADRGGADWSNFMAKMVKWDSHLASSLTNIKNKATNFSDKLNEIAHDDIPRIIGYIKKAFNLFGADFSKWCNKNSSRFEGMLNRILDVCGLKIPQIREYLKSIFYQEAGAKQPKKAGGGKVEKPKTPMQQRVRRNLSKKGKSKAKIEAQATMLDSYLDETSDYNTDNNLQTELQNRYNEYKNRENKFKRGKISKALRDEAWESYNSLNQAAWEGLGYKFYPQDKKSNKVPKGKNGRSGRQEDAELKRLQERLSSLKSARQMYQKYKSIMPDEEAKEKTYNLFPEVTGLNLDDYQKAVHSILEGFSINTTERKKFQTSIYREVAEWLFDEKDKKEYERKAADFNESMNKLSERWDLYKELFSKTGDKNFSSAAFSNPGYIDDKAKELIVEYNNKFGKDFQRENAMSMSDGVAKETLKGPGEYEAWKKIVDLLRNNYIKILQDAADIIEKTEDYEDKILKIRERYNKLISKTNDPGIKARYEIQRDKEIGQVKLDKFKNSSDYLNFYGAIVSLGMDKAQAIGARIRQNINEALQSGAIDAREYAKEIKQLDEQLKKLTNPRKTFLNGGLKGMAEQKISDASEQMTIAASKIAEGKKVRELGLKMGDENFIGRGDSMIASGKKMMKAAEVLFKDGTAAKESIDNFANTVGLIDQNVQGLCEAFNDIKETASILGVDTESDGWQDASAFFETFSGMSSSLSKVVTSAESGNVGGIIAGVTGIFTSPIKAFAKAHDAKLDRQIKLAERQLNELKNLSSNISSVVSKTLGGVYSYSRSSDTTKKLNDIKKSYEDGAAFAKTKFGRIFDHGKNRSPYSNDTYEAAMKTEVNQSMYADQLALLRAQKDQLAKQRASESKKKDSDSDKLADYDQQIKEMELQIKTFAQDFLKDVYSIDMKSWASTLTDTIVSAWAKGEDAVDAYKKKVKDMVRDVVKNIITQKIMEKALEKPLEWLTSVLDKKGQLDETDMINFAKQVNEIGDKVVPQITGLADALKNEGLDMREDGSSSATNSIKGITEETADILASYLNSIRLYCAEDNANLKQLTELTKSVLPEISVIARSQLTAMNQLVTLAEYRNGRLDDMYDWMRSVTRESGSKSLRLK